MTRIRQLDLTLLTAFAPPGVFTRIDPEVEEQLTPVPHVRDRVLGCVEFCHMVHIGRVPSQLREAAQTLPGRDELVRRGWYLRAALAEFVSMDDAARNDFTSLAERVTPRMLATPDPRLHVVRLLRHANVHLSASLLSHMRRSAAWDGPNGRHAFVYVSVVADNLAESIHATRDATSYGVADLTAMIDWLDTEQRQWGIDHTVLRCAELYAAVVAAAITM